VERLTRLSLPAELLFLQRSGVAIILSQFEELWFGKRVSRPLSPNVSTCSRAYICSARLICGVGGVGIYFIVSALPPCFAKHRTILSDIRAKSFLESITARHRFTTTMTVTHLRKGNKQIIEKPHRLNNFHFKHARYFIFCNYSCMLN